MLPVLVFPFQLALIRDFVPHLVRNASMFLPIFQRTLFRKPDDRSPKTEVIRFRNGAILSLFQSVKSSFKEHLLPHLPFGHLLQKEKRNG